MHSADHVQRLYSQLSEHTTAFVLFYQPSEEEEGLCLYGGNYLACQSMAESACDSFGAQVIADCEDDLDELDDDDSGDVLAKT